MGVGNYMKQLRADNKESQQRWSMDFDVSRESISAYETERARIPEDILQKVTEKYNDPWLGLIAAAEYTGWGPQKLDGESIDLHRCAVAMKTEEELKEALQAIANVHMAAKPSSLQAYEKQAMEKALLECIDSITALTHFVAVISQDYGFSWIKMWEKHRVKLIARGYLKKA
ncbi:XRE family transcriptional regulator [Schinkia sp. CFF1]